MGLQLFHQHLVEEISLRVRDYGFLQGKAKQRLALVQLILRVRIAARAPCLRPPMYCPRCKTPMHVVGQIVRRPDG